MQAGKISALKYFPNCFWDSVYSRKYALFLVKVYITTHFLQQGQKGFVLQGEGELFFSVIVLPYLPAPSPPFPSLRNNKRS
jgi:hypothetical protein